MVQEAFSHFLIRRRNTNLCGVTWEYVRPSRNILRITTGNTFSSRNQNRKYTITPHRIRMTTPRLSEPVMDPIAATAVTTIEPDVT